MGIDRSNTVPFITAMMKTYSKVEHTESLRGYLHSVIENNNIATDSMKTKINNAKNLDELKSIGSKIVEMMIEMEGGGRHREMNVKDIKELCKANQIKLSRVVDGKRVAYKKKELMTKLKRKKLL
jgi:hypothetical protein